VAAGPHTYYAISDPGPGAADPFFGIESTVRDAVGNISRSSCVKDSLEKGDVGCEQSAWAPAAHYRSGQAQRSDPALAAFFTARAFSNPASSSTSSREHQKGNQQGYAALGRDIRNIASPFRLPMIAVNVPKNTSEQSYPMMQSFSEILNCPTAL